MELIEACNAYVEAALAGRDDTTLPADPAALDYLFERFAHFEVAELSRDLFAELAFAQDRDIARAVISARLAGCVAVRQLDTPWVYVIDPDTLSVRSTFEGQPSVPLTAKLPAMLRFTQLMDDSRSGASKLEDDELEAALAAEQSPVNPTERFDLFEAFYDAPLPEVWDGLSRGQWPVGDPVPPAPDVDDGNPYVNEELGLYLIASFVQQRSVELPPGFSENDLVGPVKVLFDHLDDLSLGILSKTAPELAITTAQSDGGLAEEAAMWIQLHDTWREGADRKKAPPAETKKADPLAALLGLALDGDDEDEVAEEIPDTPFTRMLRQAITDTVNALTARELLEVEDNLRDHLLTELMEAAADARSPKHMLKKLTKCLVNSDNIEEVFATDDDIRSEFNRRLGG